MLIYFCAIYYNYLRLQLASVVQWLGYCIRHPWPVTAAGPQNVL